MKKYWELAELKNYILFCCFVFCYWVVQILFFSTMKRTKAFIWGSIYFCTMDGFFRIFKKAVSELICTLLYLIPYWCNIFLPGQGCWLQFSSSLAFLSLHLSPPNIGFLVMYLSLVLLPPLQVFEHWVQDPQDDHEHSSKKINSKRHNFCTKKPGSF